MHLKSPPLQIPEDNPFAEDVLGRGASAAVLTQLVSNLTQPTVISIHSSWGTGKTTFIRMWMQSLKNDGYPCIYFNAWENDIADDPLVSLIGEVDAAIDSFGGDGGKIEKAKAHFKKAKKYGAILLKDAVPVAVKLMTAGAVDLAHFKTEEIASLAEKLATEQIEKYQAHKNTINDFKKQLSDFIHELSAEAEGKAAKPLVFFIDELDRCRPDYALQLLEKAKHLFNIDGIVFVLALDRNQMRCSLKSIYGEGLDADGYLRRFIDIDYQFPTASSVAFCSAQLRRFGIDTHIAGKQGAMTAMPEPQLFLRVFPQLADLFGLSLRTQEQCFSQLAIILLTAPQVYYVDCFSLGILLALRAAKREMYFDYATRRVNGDAVVAFMKTFPKGEAFFAEATGKDVEIELKVRNADEKAVTELLTKCRATGRDESVPESERQAAWHRAGYIEQLIRLPLDWLVARIELAQQFR
jgi:hypothetical protein